MIELTIPRPRRWLKVLTVFAVVMSLSLGAVGVLEETGVIDVATTEAGTFTCVAGILVTGAAFISMAMSPPIGAVAAWLGWGSSIAGGAMTVASCQTNYLQGLIRQYYAARGLYLAYIGIVCGYSTCYGRYVSYGGGGGGSGSW